MSLRNSSVTRRLKAAAMAQIWKPQSLILDRAAEKQLAAARAVQWGYPVYFHRPSSPDTAWWPNLCPPTLFRACKATPLYYSADVRRLVLGFVSGATWITACCQAVEQISRGCRAEPCFITPTELARQLHRLTAPRKYEEAVVRPPGEARRGDDRGRLCFAAGGS